MALPTLGQSSLGQIGQHALLGGLGALQGGLGGYAVRQSQQPNQPNQSNQPNQNANAQFLARFPQFQQLNQSLQPQQPLVIPNQGQQSGQQQTAQIPGIQSAGVQLGGSSNEILQNLLQGLTHSKAQSMMSGGQSMPQQLRQNATQVANQSQGTPWVSQFGEQGPQFAFDRYLGGGGVYSPNVYANMSGNGNQITTDAAAQDQEQQQEPWWRSLAHGAGNLAQSAAPLAGMIPGYGIPIAAGLGGLGYLAQQI